MNALYLRVIGSLLRAALIAAGGASLAEGQVDEAVGAILVLVGIGWSIYEKYQSSKVAAR